MYFYSSVFVRGKQAVCSPPTESWSHDIMSGLLQHVPFFFFFFTDMSEPSFSVEPWRWAHECLGLRQSNAHDLLLRMFLFIGYKQDFQFYLFLDQKFQFPFSSLKHKDVLDLSHLRTHILLLSLSPPQSLKPAVEGGKTHVGKLKRANNSRQCLTPFLFCASRSSKDAEQQPK